MSSLYREKPVDFVAFATSFIGLVFLFLFSLESPRDRCLAFLFSLSFAFYETCFRQLKHEGFTTWEQFYLNLFSAPYYVPFYNLLSSTFKRIYFFPLIVFVVEIFGGYYLHLIWGRRAWNYSNCMLPMFNGHITLSFLPIWLGLGTFQELIAKPYFVEPATNWMLKNMNEVHWQSIIIAFALLALFEGYRQRQK